MQTQFNYACQNCAQLQYISSRDDILCFTSFLLVSVLHGLNFDQKFDQRHIAARFCLLAAFFCGNCIR